MQQLVKPRPIAGLGSIISDRICGLTVVVPGSLPGKLQVPRAQHVDRRYTNTNSNTRHSLLLSPVRSYKGLPVRSQAKDSREAKVEQGEFDEELSEQEGRLSL
jgi:hypothetical protein